MPAPTFTHPHPHAPLPRPHPHSCTPTHPRSPTCVTHAAPGIAPALATVFLSCQPPHPHPAHVHGLLDDEDILPTPTDLRDDIKNYHLSGLRALRLWHASWAPITARVAVAHIMCTHHTARAAMAHITPLGGRSQPSRPGDILSLV